MDKKELIGFLEINEPVFIYNNKEFGICNMGDFIIAGNKQKNTYPVLTNW
jgi:hypothetical protein